MAQPPLRPLRLRRRPRRPMASRRRVVVVAAAQAPRLAGVALPLELLVVGAVPVAHLASQGRLLLLLCPSLRRTMTLSRRTQSSTRKSLQRYDAH